MVSDIVRLDERFYWIALFPVFLAFIDFLEDMGQVALTLLFDVSNGSVINSSQWANLVQVTSVVNQFKWLLVRGGTLSIGIILTFTVVKSLLDRVKK